MFFTGITHVDIMIDSISQNKKNKKLWIRLQNKYNMSLIRWIKPQLDRLMEACNHEVVSLVLTEHNYYSEYGRTQQKVSSVSECFWQEHHPRYVFPLLAKYRRIKLCKAYVFLTIRPDTSLGYSPFKSNNTKLSFDFARMNNQPLPLEKRLNAGENIFQKIPDGILISNGSGCIK